MLGVKVIWWEKTWPAGVTSVVIYEIGSRGLRLSS
jgi:hypothetical protein